MKARIIAGAAVAALAVAALTAATMPATLALAEQGAGQSAAQHTGVQLVAGLSGYQDPNLSAVVASSWQTNGTVWAIASANGIVYVGGDFTSVRPPGAAAGTSEVTRSYLAAFNSSTGGLLSFQHTFDGEVTGLAVSPDGKTLYVGGAFKHVDGTWRGHIAAFDTTTGAMNTAWHPNVAGNVRSIAPSPDGSAIYFGGGFTEVNGVTRSYAAAVTAGGALLPWAPQLDGALTSVAVAPDDSRVLLGGYFSHISGVFQHGIASTDPATGTSEPWAAAILPDTSTCVSNVKDIIVQGSIAYVAAEGTGGGCFDGDFAASISNGALLWQSDCLGATQAIAIVGNWLYKGSHAHDCIYGPYGFPQVSTSSGNVTWHLLSQSLTDGGLGFWTPNTNANNLGPRVMATDGTELFLGGDFTTVNGKPQQGFARFEPGPDSTWPGQPAAPTVTSTSAGVASVTFPGVTDRDHGTLTYEIYRDGGTTPVGTVTGTSWPWAHPVLHYRDSGLTPGSQHTYTVVATDGTHKKTSPSSAPVTVSATSPSLTYPQTVLAGSPSFYWRLGEASGATAADSSSHGFTGIYEPGTALGEPGAIPGDSDTAAGLNGTTGMVVSSGQVFGPQVFSIEGWFKTTSGTGGVLAGFGNSQTGTSSNYDRNVYMMNDGQLVFGVYAGRVETAETRGSYNDGSWHYFAATLSSAGLKLYVDGQLAGTNSTTLAQAYSGYWHVGYNRLSGPWDLDPWTSSQGITSPNSQYFQGTIDEVAVYPSALSASQVAAHYAANALSH